MVSHANEYSSVSAFLSLGGRRTRRVVARRVAGRATNCAGFATVTRDRYRVVPAGEPEAREAEANGSQHKVL